MLINQILRLSSIADQLIQRGLSIPANLAFSIASTDFIEQNFLLPRYQQFLESYEKKLPCLDSEALKIIEGLEKQGVYVTTLSALGIPCTKKFLKAGYSVAAELASRSTSPVYADRHTLTATAKQLLLYPEIFWWGTSERLLKIIEAYLQLPVAYDGLSVYYSLANGRNAGPRKWHRDKEDWKMVKVCVYLNDVDENGGPYECIRPDVNDYLVSTLQPKYRVLTHRNLEEHLNLQTTDWIISCTGQAGTVIFADTARYYHRGKPPVDCDRSAIFFSYFSQRPKHPFFCGRSPLSDQQLARLAEPLPPHLRQSVTWRKHLPGIGRYIPKNRVKV
jgi:hypothetical protein